MIIEAARLAGRNLFAPESRSAFWKILGITILLLAGGWVLIRELFAWLALPWLEALVPGIPEWAGWFGFIIGIVASLGLALGMALLIAPVTAIVAGFFLDGVAEIIEERDYPGDPVGTAVPLGRAIVYTAKFFGIVVVGNIIALLLLFIPGINIASVSAGQRLPLRARVLRIRRHALPRRARMCAACGPNTAPAFSSPAC